MTQDIFDGTYRLKKFEMIPNSNSKNSFRPALYKYVLGMAWQSTTGPCSMDGAIG